MTPFLKLVADDIIRRYPEGMQDLNVVFPGKRARLFMNDYLAQAANHPIWAPTCQTMQELFTGLSPYKLIDPIEAICRLYKVYILQMPQSTETLDHFFSWGEVLLDDFDDIDKQLVDANSLFANIEDLEKLTSDHFLTKEQEATLQHFFAHFSVNDNSIIRERFRQMWHAMPQIYNAFNEEMRQIGCLTEGALYRDVIYRLTTGKLELPQNKDYAFVGLNALSEAEKQLLAYLKTEGRAIFYWDYDQAYMEEQGHEAALFMEENLRLFPNAISGTHFNNLHSRDKLFTYVATAGSNIQTRYIPAWLSSLPSTNEQAIPDTAIVLCDEALLGSVLHSIPDAGHGGPQVANITMGYPLTSTPVYALIKALLTLHTDGWNNDSKRLRTHERRIAEYNPLIRKHVKEGRLNLNTHQDGNLWLVTYVQSVLEFIAAQQAEQTIDTLDKHDSSAENALLNESIYRSHNAFAKIAELIKNDMLSVSTPCLVNIINHVLTRIRIPFHGEPAEGLQIMGVLETRCLDFDNLLMLGVNEGKMPQNDRTASFIPYSLRRPFGLTTIEHRVSIHAYNFYRLIQRARNITFVYDTANSEGIKNEMSRFLRQLLVEMRHGEKFPDVALSLRPEIAIPSGVSITAKKSASVIQQLSAIEKLSPSAIEEYISCPVKYYLHYIGGVKEFDEQEDEMDAKTFGNIFHSSAESIYKQFIGRELTHTDLNHYLNGRQGERELIAIVESKFHSEYFSKQGLPHEITTGDMTIRRDVIVGYLQNLLRNDLRTLDNVKRQILSCEQSVETSVILPDGRIVTIGGIIDRLDLVTDSSGVSRLQIIDYKTMSRSKDNPSSKLTMDDVFAQKERYIRHIFQTFLYALTLMSDGRPIQPTVFYTQDSSSRNYSTDIRYGGGILYDFRPYADDFRAHLVTLIQQIFDTNIPFTQTDDKTHCTYCPFKDICKL